MSYIPNANDSTNPLDTTDRSTAAAEFRTLKTWLHEITTLASSATPDIFNQPTQLINYTGTVLATGFVAALQAGMVRRLLIPSAAQFTAGANLLIDGVASGTTITITPGSVVLVIAVTTTQFRLLMEADVGSIQGYVGEVRQGFFVGGVGIPVGWAQVLNAAGGAQVISRATYPVLNACMSALGYPFGAGDGATTFGMPWIPPGYTWAQIVTALGAGTVGVVLNHDHPNGILSSPNSNWPGYPAATSSGYATSVGYLQNTGNPTSGGAANLPASIGVNYIMRMG